MSRVKALQSKNTGFAIVLTLLVLVILLLMGKGLLDLSLHNRMLAVRTSSENAAQRAADAGLVKAVFEMNKKLAVKPWTDYDLPAATDEILPGSAATFTYKVSGDVESGLSIESIGKSGRVQRKINCNLPLEGLFEHVIFVAETVSIKNNNMVDGYNSDTGETGVKVRIGTGSTAPGSINFGLNTIVDGDVLVGVGGDPETVIYNEGTVTGETYAASEECALPAISPPTLPDMGTIDVQTTTILGPADNGKYAGITSNGGTLEIAGGDVVLHVAGNINMNNGSVIQINDGSSLTLYVDGDMTFVNNAGINNLASVCTNFKIYSTGAGEQLFELQNNSSAFGAIYAPNTNIILNNNADLYGAMTCKSFTIMNNGRFCYDAALRNVGVNDDGVRFVVKQWREE